MAPPASHGGAVGGGGCRGPLVWGLAVFTAAACLFGATAHGYLENTDAEITLHAADAWARRGEPRLLAAAPDATLAESIIVEQFVAQGNYGMPAADGHGVFVWFPIGHQALMLGAVWLGSVHDAMFPGAADHYMQVQGGPARGALYGARFVASFLSPFAAAVGVLALVVLARALGRDRRQALGLGALAALATQWWPGSSETTSDMPGAGLLLASIAAVAVAAGRATGSRAALLAASFGGALAGAAVLVRYPLGLAVAVIGGYFLFQQVRSGGSRSEIVRRFGAFVLGGLPFLLLLLWANHWRFGEWTETGYSAGANAGWFSYPPWVGIPLVLLAPGKGVLWFSPALWLALARLRHRAVRRHAMVVASGLALAATVVLIGHTAGWAAGQCWGIRYLTPLVVWFSVASGAVGPPVRWTALPTLLLAVLGLLVSAGGVLTQYTSHHKLATAAARAMFPDADEAQLPEHVDFQPVLSPVHGHWRYAARVVSGRLRRGDAALATHELFGVEPGRIPEPGPRLRWMDVGFHHWWWLGRPAAAGGDGFAARGAALVMLLVGVGAAWCAVRGASVHGVVVHGGDPAGPGRTEARLRDAPADRD